MSTGNLANSCTKDSGDGIIRVNVFSQYALEPSSQAKIDETSSSDDFFPVWSQRAYL